MVSIAIQQEIQVQAVYEEAHRSTQVWLSVGIVLNGEGWIGTKVFQWISELSATLLFSR